MKNYTLISIFFLIALISKGDLNAQIVIGTPNLGFSQACAGPSFNTYNVTFTFSPETSLGASNQFVLELSDSTGSFSNPNVVFISNSGALTSSPATISFSLPTTTSGEAYKLRVKSTNPVATSANSIAFPAYYKIQDSPFSINNLISTAAYCSGGSYLLTIDNPGTGSNDSPLQYPSLTFNWYKETSPTTSVFVASGNSLSVDQPGTYFVETNYGSCTSNSYSNRVTIGEASSQVTSSISSSLGNPYCSSEGPTTLSALNGVAYQWYKDGIEISGATNQMYTTNEPGTYLVTVNLGDCQTNASINLVNSGFASEIDVTGTNVLEDGEILVATVTTDAVNPVFEWYLNNTLIPNANSNSYGATELGNYKVVINQTSGCIASNEFEFSIIEPFPDVPNIPNVISPNGDGINDTWVIPQEYVSGTNTEVLVLSPQGKVMLQTNDYQNNWPQNQLDFKDVNPVFYYIITTQDNKTRKGSITVVK